MPSLDHTHLTGALLPYVLQAGAVQMGYFHDGVAVEAKRDASPVTAADHEAEEILLAGLAAAAPGVPVIAEEAVAKGHVPAPSESFFLVDPLDGTREFIAGRTEFTVNVALIAGGAPVFGIVYAPALAELYVTMSSNRAGLAKIKPNAPAEACQPIEIRARRADANALVAVASRSHSTTETEDFLARYRISERRNAGSSLKFGLIAQGLADIYPRLGPTMQWDTAAGHAVLLAAGGSVTTLDGRPLLYGRQPWNFRNPHFVAWGVCDPAAQLTAGSRA
jgi:3'(2'), 5'-bisphosphate nucleotidase